MQSTGGMPQSRSGPTSHPETRVPLGEAQGAGSPRTLNYVALRFPPCPHLAMNALHLRHFAPALLLLTLSLPAAEPGSTELAAVGKLVAEAKNKLGDRAGVPEVEDKFLAIPRNGSWMTPVEAREAIDRAPAKLEKLRWWKPGLDPSKLTHALREPAAVIGWGVQVHRAGADRKGRALALAREAGDFLIWAQDEAGTGGFPFPAVRSDKHDKAFAAAERYLSAAEKAGRLDAVVHRGWTVDDAGDGGLQFDNGEAGFAQLELYRATNDQRYLVSARRAADWALARPLARNWNYNSFSVHLLAAMFVETHDDRYLAAAKHKAIVGMIPGQLTDGPRAGRWLDPHNARPTYHYIMMRALAGLAAAMPKDDPARPEIVRALQLGLQARNREILGPGAPNKDKAMEALVMVRQLFADDPEFLRDSLSLQALDALGKLVSEQWRRGSDPLGPREWGMFLNLVIAPPTSAEKTAPVKSNAP